MSEVEDAHEGHPGVGEYVSIAAILAVITGIEVAFSFVSVPRAVFVPSLLFLTVLKFGLVVLWFMHLRFDSKWFRRLFFVGLALAGVIFAIMGATFYFTGTSLGFG